jgi:hypothetical protein
MKLNVTKMKVRIVITFLYRCTRGDKSVMKLNVTKMKFRIIITSVQGETNL